MCIGFGIKNKILEVMVVGIFVVVSNCGLEGLVVDGVGKLLRVLRVNYVEEYVEVIGWLFEDR